MPRYEAFVLRIWRGRGGPEEQCAVRLEHLPDGRSLRFSDPELLLAYLRDLLRADKQPQSSEPYPIAVEQQQTADTEE